MWTYSKKVKLLSSSFFLFCHQVAFFFLKKKFWLCVLIRICTKSVGLLSYTFLRRTQLDRIVVPMVSSIPDFYYLEDSVLLNLTLLWWRMLLSLIPSVFPLLSTIMTLLSIACTFLLTITLLYNEGSTLVVSFDATRW